ncbi:MAG: PD-(D/E)XK nuclease family protein [Pseudomonadota bacterium]|nr:MAG: PD-(D/E)XK nuclease family protein [Pseudomonadota bacterium]
MNRHAATQSPNPPAGDGGTSPCQLVPYGQDPLVVLARRIIEEQAAKLPDLTDVTVLLPASRTAARLRQCLLDAADCAGHNALLGPHITTLREWAAQHAPANPTCDAATRELMLVEALRDHPALIGSANPWTLAEGLLQLFDELTANRLVLPRSLDEFEARLRQAYGVGQRQVAALSREAQLVHSLWNAWHTQLKSAGLIDSEAAHVLALGQSLQDCHGVLYLAGLHDLSGAERDWLTALVRRDAARVLLHGQVDEQAGDYHPDAPVTRLWGALAPPAPPSTPQSDYARALDAVWAPADTPLAERARYFARDCAASPVRARLELFTAASAEEEAHAIDIQVRRWLIAGKCSIGVVTENRKLARRIRALLERADIAPQDVGGWALSTTSAAAAVERWLECVEEDFAYLPLIDLLKSPFVLGDLEPDRLREAVYRLEQDIVHRESTASDLARYRRRVGDRAERLYGWLPNTSQLLLAVFDRLEQAAKPLHILRRKRKANATTLLDALQASFDTLGMTAALAQDAAGSRLLQVLEHMHQAAARWPAQMDWLEFRAWLGRNLEQFHFTPQATAGTVQLTTLAQSRLQCFDAVVIAGAEHEFLPGTTTPTPFFNNSVRRELGLTTLTEKLAARFHEFRRLLESAPHILITARGEQDGEVIPRSPWLDALCAFHQFAWGEGLEVHELHALVDAPSARVVRTDTRTLPSPTRRPVPLIDAAQIPRIVSASDYQSLIDCPYQFYAARCLRLAPPEEIRLALSKADYGELVHRCLEAFHADLPNLPGPFDKDFSAANRDAAIAMLYEIAARVFARDLRDNFEHRAWLQQWQKQIPDYIDWQIKRATEWRVAEIELRAERELVPGIRVKGRIDRIDQSDQGAGIVDYKTGAIRTLDDVRAGEAVQLPFYALLHEGDAPIQRVEYLKLDEPDTSKPLEGDELHEISTANGARLKEIIAQFDAGAGLPAWGDDAACRYCDMMRLCRRGLWADDASEAETGTLPGGG